MSFELTPKLSLDKLINYNLKSELFNTNEKSSQYGLILTEKDAEMLVKAGKEAISTQDRVEFGKSITIKIIEKFMKSTYISQSDYADSIACLIDIFYEAKEESLDILTDDEVIDIMYNFFERESGGSLEILHGRDMDYLCRKIRNTANGIADDDNHEPEEDFDE
ncbi:MAG: DUF6323 family protein [Oscillospiraceae bacterium]